mgnify:CR=1 FL=1
MTKARDLANLIGAGNPLADGAISVAEISGLTASAAELNKLDGVTASTTELNKLAGVTASTTELNKLDGLTSSTADLNNVAGINSSVQAQLNAKAPLANPTFTGAVTATSFSGNGSNLTGVDSLPSQSSHSGKFLTTDGTNPTWATLQAETEITSNRSYWITDASITNQIVGKFNKIQVVPANTSITGTWQVASDAEVYITEVTSIDSFGEFLEGTQTISGNHIFYKQLEVLDGSTITVTGTLEGFGDSPAAGASTTSGLTSADVTALIDGSTVFESFGGA